MRRVQYFVPMGSELEVQRLKKAGQEVLEEPVKRQNIREASGSGEEQSAEKEKELSEEELQKLLLLVLVEEVYVEALQVKYPIIDCEVYSKDTRRYWRVIRVGNHTEAYQIFADILKIFDRDDLVELKRLFKPDNDDTLWKLQRYMHDPLVWKAVIIHVVSPLLQSVKKGSTSGLQGWIRRIRMKSIRHMAPLPPRDQRHRFLRYEGLEYTDSDIADFELRLERIYTLEIHRVQVVDFLGMPDLLRDGLFARMTMEHRDKAGVVVFTSQVSRRLFNTRGPLIWELILDFLSTLRFGEVLLDIDALD
ncbi:hypothetical protein Tco_1305448, partial [Tanacetum coccineum]